MGESETSDSGMGFEEGVSSKEVAPLTNRAVPVQEITGETSRRRRAHQDHLRALSGRREIVTLHTRLALGTSRG